MTKSSYEKKIGIIGLGVLGSAIAKNFIDKNISISGYDINEKVFEGLKSNKIKAYDSIDEISDKCEILITSLPSETSLIKVAKSLFKNDKLIIIESSTLPLDCKLEAKNIYKEAREKTLKEINTKKEKLENQINEEIKKAEIEISLLRKNAHKKINKIAIETTAELLKKLIGAEVNNSSISAIVEDLSKRNESKYYDN